MKAAQILAAVILCLCLLTLGACGDTLDLSAATVEMARIDEALPYAAEDAALARYPLGSTPMFYVFDEGLTFYLYWYAENVYYECALTLPGGCTDGRIFMLSQGGGSGEMHVIVEAEYAGEAVYISYLFVGAGLESVELADEAWVEELQEYQDTM